MKDESVQNSENTGETEEKTGLSPDHLVTNEDKKNKKNGIEAENLFQRQLNKNDIPFIRFDQTKETFSDKMKENHMKRPDYFLHTRHSAYYIDVKYRAMRPFGNDEERFTIDQRDMFMLYNFQTEFHSNVWLAFTDNLKEPNFNYISITSLYNYFTDIFLNSEKYPKEHEKFISLFYIFIPDTLFYHRLSFDQGFYKNQKDNFIDNETELYKVFINRFLNKRNSISLSETDGYYCMDCAKIISFNKYYPFCDSCKQNYKEDGDSPVLYWHKFCHGCADNLEIYTTQQPLCDDCFKERLLIKFYKKIKDNKTGGYYEKDKKN